MNFEVLRKANVERDKEWSEGEVKFTPLFRATELAGEVGEACNVVKKLEREAMGLRGSRSSKISLATELADVIICADLLAMEYGIDLAAAVRVKFNSTSIDRGLKTRIE